MPTLDAVIASHVALERTQSLVATLFGLLATTLSAVGLYGLLAHLVGGRQPEIGLRRALGAGRAELFGGIVFRGMMLTAVGCAIGSAAAFLLTRILQHQVFGLTSFDPAAVITGALVLLSAAFGACNIPAWRATRIDPAEALRDA